MLECTESETVEDRSVISVVLVVVIQYMSGCIVFFIVIQKLKRVMMIFQGKRAKESPRAQC